MALFTGLPLTGRCFSTIRANLCAWLVLRPMLRPENLRSRSSVVQRHSSLRHNTSVQPAAFSGVQLPPTNLPGQMSSITYLNLTVLNGCQLDEYERECSRTTFSYSMNMSSAQERPVTTLNANTAC